MKKFYFLLIGVSMLASCSKSVKTETIEPDSIVVITDSVVDTIKVDTVNVDTTK